MVLYRHVKYQDSLKSIDHVLREKRKGPFSDLFWSLPYFFPKQEISTKTNIQYFWKYIYFLYFFFLLLLSLVLYFHVINLMYKFGEIGKSSFLGNKGFPRVLQVFYIFYFETLGQISDKTIGCFMRKRCHRHKPSQMERQTYWQTDGSV